MALQYSVEVRDARNNATEATIGASPTLEVFSGQQPANCAAVDSGTLIGSGQLPADWLTDSVDAVKNKLGTWNVVGLPAAGAGMNMGHFRIKQSTTCHMQGAVTLVGLGGEMQVNNLSIANGQTITFNTASITGSNP